MLSIRLQLFFNDQVNLEYKELLILDSDSDNPFSAAAYPGISTGADVTEISDPLYRPRL